MKLNSVDLNKVKVFSRVMESGSCSLAAEQLHLTRSAVSQSIAALETTLQTTLFHRVGRKLHPTDKAERLYRSIKPHLMQLENSFLGLKSEDTVEQELRIGTFYEFAKNQLIEPLKKYKALHPRVQVRLVFDSPSRLQDLLDRHRIDLCFSIFPHRDSQEILCQEIFKEELVLIAPTGRHLPKAAEDIGRVPVIDYFANHQLFPRWFELHYGEKPPTQPHYFAGTAEMVLEMVSEGMGIGLVPSYLLRDRYLSLVKVFRPTAKQLVDHIWLSRYRHLEKDSVVTDFCRFTKNHFSLLSV